MIFGKPRQEKKADNSVKMGNVNAGNEFKISWTKFKKAHHTCDIEGRDSDNCRRHLKEIGIEFVDE